MSFYEANLPWNAGEKSMHNLFHVSHDENPTSPFLTPYASSLLVRCPLVALGTLDSEDWPWTTILGGEAGFSQPVAQSIIGLRTTVDRLHDPVLQAILGSADDGEVVHERDGGKMVGGLAIDLDNRRRVKLYGKSVAGTISATEEGAGDLQLVVKIEQSLGNCPKYLNKKRIIPHVPEPILESTSFPLPPAAVELLAKADLFFISSSNHHTDMDTNHRGGPPGFTRIMSNNEDGFTLVYPEYSGNRLYQTLGNLQSTPRAGLVFPDFETGDVLYVTGVTEILAGQDASNLIAHTNLAVKIDVKAFRFVRNGLGFRGLPGAYSPYNPPVRYLKSEDSLKVSQSSSKAKATLVDKTSISSTISRFKFKLSGLVEGEHWKVGQYVALDFSDELDTGYSHMRESDPTSLNDDWLRTFTISSGEVGESGGDQFFELTLRKVGPVTEYLFRINVRAELEVGVQGFGGEFFIQQPESQNVSYIAAGIGITPLLAQASGLDFKRFQLYWTIRGEDLALVAETFEAFPKLSASTKLFITGTTDDEGPAWKAIEVSDATVAKARLSKTDLDRDVASKYYICTGTTRRNNLLQWLAGKSTLYEGFNY